jgi:hypothetical protein
MTPRVLWGGGRASHRGRVVVHELPALFVVGQTLPRTQVPAPRSRAMNDYHRNLVKFYVAREFTRPDNIKKRVSVDRALKAFPMLAPVNVRRQFNVREPLQRW